jgi:hypothetical protein
VTIQFQIKMKKIKQMPVCEVSESKPLWRVHVPRVHARAACDHPIPN